MTSTNKPSHTARNILVIFLGIIILAIAITLFVCSYTYSEGSRAGIVLNFSKKGYFLKTYEGELNMGGMGNVSNTTQMNLIWDFSVKNQAVADTLMKLEGKKVSLHYKERIKNRPWQGETKDFIDKVTTIK